MNFIEAVTLIIVVIVVLALGIEIGLRGIYEELYLGKR